MRVRHWMMVLLGLLAVPVVLFLVWYTSLLLRPLINDDVRARAVIHSDRQKLRQHGRHRHNWFPLRTNLLRPDSRGIAVGGLGLALHFRFQCAALVLTLFAILTWLLMSSYSKDLSAAVESTGLVMSPLQVYRWCNTSRAELVQARHASMEVEILVLAYTAIFYVCATVGSLTFASWQRSFFARWAAKVTTMQDYALFLAGFPEEAGETVEEERLEFVRQACNCDPVGVSVCWDFEDCEEEVMNLMRREMLFRQRSQSRDSIRAADLRRARSFFRNVQAENAEPSLQAGLLTRLGHFKHDVIAKLSTLDAFFLPGSSDGEHHEMQDEVLGVLADIQSTEHICVVFSSMQDRDLARERFRRGGPCTLFRGRHPVRASGMEQDMEPDTVLWQHLGSAKAKRRRRVLFSIFKIILAIALWAGCLYVPWGYYVGVYMDAFGELPSFAADTAFTILVVVGNQLLYFLCDKAARSVALSHTGEQEALYSVLYSLAILVNMCVDLLVLRLTSAKALAQFGMKVPLESLRLFMSSRFFKYNFPSCFLIPFMAEPMVLYVLPFDLVTRLIGTREMRQTEADEMLQPVPMDLSRYQDILLNITQAVTALFLDHQYMLQTWVGLLVGQFFIYLWDHFKVLRVVRSFNFSSFLSELVAQRLTAFPCGILAACVGFRIHRLMSLRDDVHNTELAAADPRFSFKTSSGIFVAILVHVSIHLYVLQRMMPQLTSKDCEDAWASKPTYKEIAMVRPANYFNTNPIHCLRSRYLHLHDPPCNFYVSGKEHTLAANPRIGQYYQAKQWDDRRKTLSLEMAAVKRRVRQSITRQPELTRTSSTEGPSITSSRLWKLCHLITELFMAEHRQYLKSSTSDGGVETCRSGRHDTVVGPLGVDSPPWKSLTGWRRRFFELRDFGNGTAELVYASEKTDYESIACVLARNDESLQVQPLPRLKLDPLNPWAQQEIRQALHTYELACVPRAEGTAAGAVGVAEQPLPSELCPLVLSWMDNAGIHRQLVIATESEEGCVAWLHNLRSYCCTTFS